MKSRINRVLFRDEWNIMPEPVAPLVLEEFEDIPAWKLARMEKRKKRNKQINSNEDNEDDAVWGSLRVVRAKMKSSIDKSAYKMTLFDNKKKKKGGHKIKGKLKGKK